MLFTHSSSTEQTLSIFGSFDAKHIDELRQSFEEQPQKQANHVTVDLSNTNYMDTSGIGAITYLYKRLIENDKTMSLSGVHGQPEVLLRHLGLHKSIDINFIH